MRTPLSIAYKLGSIISLCVLITSCDPGGKYDDIVYTHQLQVENASSKSFTLEAYDTYNEQHREYLDEAILKQTITIESNNKGPIVVAKTYSFRIDSSSYFPELNCDSLVLKFENGRGYYTTFLYKNGNDFREIDTENWIANKSTLLKIFSQDVRKEGDVYIYTITQEDYENAYELP